MAGEHASVLRAAAVLTRSGSNPHSQQSPLGPANKGRGRHKRAASAGRAGRQRRAGGGRAGGRQPPLHARQQGASSGIMQLGHKGHARLLAHADGLEAQAINMHSKPLRRACISSAFSSAGRNSSPLPIWMPAAGQGRRQQAVSESHWRQRASRTSSADQGKHKQTAGAQRRARSAPVACKACANCTQPRDPAAAFQHPQRQARSAPVAPKASANLT